MRLSMLAKDTSTSDNILNAIKILIFHFCLGQILFACSLLKIVVYNTENNFSSS